jgi:hypothetical protein
MDIPAICLSADVEAVGGKAWPRRSEEVGKS